MRQQRQVHLAVFTPPFLDLILDGSKTIESRFARVRCAPHGRVNVGDRVLMKASGGPVRGEFLVDRVDFWEALSGVDLQPIAKDYGRAIRADVDPQFWQSRQGCRYVTLMHIRDVKRYDLPRPFPKRDRRGWVILGSDDTSI